MLKDKDAIIKFQETIILWQQNHGRHHLPWQQNPTPYRVLVSEVMLQQTQVKTVIPYFNHWMQLFPDIKTLAKSGDDQIMAAWQGLGYYSRARNLKKAAEYIFYEKKNIFPKALDELCLIPGVGPYTAGAIRSFAYNCYGPIVDGNTKRLFCRLFELYGVVNSSAMSKKLWAIADELTPKTNNRIFAQALIDLGATCCTPKKPNCNECPLKDQCTAFDKQIIDKLPTSKEKKALPIKKAHFIWVEKDNKIFLEKRQQKAVWQGLWCLPEVKQFSQKKPLKKQFNHTFTHYKLNGFIWENDTISVTKGQFFSSKELQEIGLPTPIKKAIHALKKDKRL